VDRDPRGSLARVFHPSCAYAPAEAPIAHERAHTSTRTHAHTRTHTRFYLRPDSSETLNCAPKHGCATPNCSASGRMSGTEAAGEGGDGVGRRPRPRHPAPLRLSPPPLPTLPSSLLPSLLFPTFPRSLSPESFPLYVPPCLPPSLPFEEGVLCTKVFSFIRRRLPPVLPL
jgi:hypothetical protein